MRELRESQQSELKWLTRVATRMCESYQRESDISFEVRVSDEILCNAWDLPDLKFVDLCNHRFLFIPEKKILSAGFLIFSRKKRVTKTSRSNVILAHFSIKKVILDHVRSF